MEIYKIEDLTFRYPTRQKEALRGVSLTVEKGEFITVCGKSGCGKTTLLRLLKTTLAPHGALTGSIFFNGAPLSHTDNRTQSEKIGFVLQNPENQTVTDKVWHELAFGLESLGYSTPEIRTRVAEMASFFGIEKYFHKKVSELSGGGKQLLSLASVMVMQPDVLILDEPTSQLDPIAAQEFLRTLERINRELGTTVILSEHRLEEAFPISDRVIVMDGGKIISDASPADTGEALSASGHDMYSALPVPMRIFSVIQPHLPCPVTVREGRCRLEKYAQNEPLHPERIPKPKEYIPSGDYAVELKDVWFRYEKDQPDIAKGLSLCVEKGEIFAIVGGNGTGKSTALSLISGLFTPYRGKVLINGTEITKLDTLYDGLIGVLPQDPQTLFARKTLSDELYEMLDGKNLPEEQKRQITENIISICRLDGLSESHPYDLSGGEQQRAALAKILLTKPKILLLDEPTKGLDAHFKLQFAQLLYDLKKSGVTVIMVSHDIEFCAYHVDRCAMLFDGVVTAADVPRRFFAGKSFYTTAASRLSRTLLPDALLAEDVIAACGKEPPEQKKDGSDLNLYDKITPSEDNENKKNAVRKEKKLTPKRIVLGCVFAIIFILAAVFLTDHFSGFGDHAVTLFMLVDLALCLGTFFPQKSLGGSSEVMPQEKRKLSGRTLTAALMVLFAIPLTIYVGIFYFGDSKYYFISLMIILETIIPFLLVFEKRKPQARELVIISVLCAIAVAGRAAFYMLPQFKPVIAVIILAGLCFGGESGFLVGAVTGFVSNFFFGQGPWTPWQMFAFGIIGFLAGVLFKKGMLRRTRLSLSIFGAFSAIVLYGGILNPASVIIAQPRPTSEMILSAYAAGLPFDMIHAAATAFFLWFAAEPMIDKLERIKIKYGLIS